MQFHNGSSSRRLIGSSLHLLAALACLLFAWHFGTKSLTRAPLANHDELRTLSHIFGRSVNTPQSLQETITNVATTSEQHGPLYFLLLNVWSRVAGSDLFILRLLSTYFALLSLAAIYHLARISRLRHQALAALFIVSLNSLFLFYSRELRMYTLLPFLVVWIVWCYWRLLEAIGGVNWWIWLSLALGCGLILYLHYFGIFILAALAMYHLLFARKNRRWIHITLALMAGGSLFLPWLPTVLKGLEGFSNKSFSGMSAFESLVSLGNVYSNDFWILPLGALIIVVWYRKLLSKPQRFLLILTFLAIAVLLLANEIKPILIAKRLRYMLLLAPLLGSALAIAWHFLPRRAPAQFLLAAVWILSFFTYSQSENSYIASKRKSLESLYAPPFYTLVYHPNIEVRPTESVLSLHPSRKITWITGDYYQKLIKPSNLVHIYYDGGGRLTIQTTGQPIGSLDEFVSRHAAFWLLYDPQETDERSMGDIFWWARNYYRSCGRYLEETHAVVERYVRDSDPC
ncbi:MAG: glycosyltransferase family 39 protein [Chloroflexota bacterium]|nr:glycosyltransferase family 39 protein [Chloroflexota bacterium]